MKRLLLFCIVSTLLHTPASAGNQLYTGDAFTVPPGKAQFQLFQDTTPNRTYRLAGSALTIGLTYNLDFRAAYSYLWNNIGPDAKIGPNFGFKWRFIGDGRRKPSMAVSALHSSNTTIGAGPRNTNFGALLIGSYPSRHFTFLGNLGRVWTGEDNPDLYYLSFALVRNTSKYTLMAVEYSDLRRTDRSGEQSVNSQYALGVVYSPDKKWSYSLQVGYLPENPRFSYRTTLGISVYF